MKRNILTTLVLIIFVSCMVITHMEMSWLYAIECNLLASIFAVISLYTLWKV
jgi:hypothetical protein